MGKLIQFRYNLMICHLYVRGGLGSFNSSVKRTPNICGKGKQSYATFLYIFVNKNQQYITNSYIYRSDWQYERIDVFA